MFYIIQGGGQKVTQNEAIGIKTIVEKREGSIASVTGGEFARNDYTNAICSYDLNEVLEDASEWAGKEIKYQLK